MNAQSQTFASLLRRHRLAAGLSQEELAERAGLSRRGVSDLERGVKRSPHRDTILRLADALGLEGQERSLFAALARGQSSPLSGDRARPPDALPHHSAPFVGRRHELALLDDHRALRTPPLLFVAGEPGIGKSRLLAEAALCAAAQGWRVIAGGCTRRSGQEPYEPFVSALARAVRHTPPARQRMDLQGCGWLVRLLPELLETRVAPAPAWTVPPEQERRLMFDAVARYLANVAGPAGTLLVLDDLQWAGQDALALLAALLDGLADSDGPALRLVCAYRDTELAPADPLGLLAADLISTGSAARISLRPLAWEEAQSLLEQVWRDMLADAPADVVARGAADDPEVLQDKILRRADGLPFYIVSSARAMQTPVRDEEGNIKAHIPSSVAESIRARVAVLPRAAREVLSVAAVVGRVIAGMLLMAVAPRAEDEVLDALDRLRQAGLLVEDGEDGYRFTHDLIREVVEADLGARRRRVLHCYIAEALEHLPMADRARKVAALADHFARAGEPVRALPYALLAGDQAEAASAHAEASAHFRAAARYADAAGERTRKAEAMEKLGVSLLRYGHTDPALAALDEAAQLYAEFHDQESRYRTLAALIETHWHRGTAEEGLAKVRPLLAALEEQGETVASPALAALYKSVCAAHRLDGQHEERARAAQRLERLARELRDDALLFAALQYQYYTALLRGVADTTVTALLDLIPIAERVGDPGMLLEAYNHVAAEYLFRGEFSLSLAYNQRALGHAQRTGSPPHITRMLINRAETGYYSGAWADARADIAQADAIAEESNQFGITYSSLYRLYARGLLDVAEGHEELARRQLYDVLQAATGSHDLQAQAHSRQLLSELDLLGGRATEVYASLPPLLDQLQVVPYWADATRIYLAWALLAMGRQEEAAHEIETCIAGMRVRTMRLWLVDGLRVRAMLAIQRRQWEAAQADVDEAIALAGAMPYPYAELKALWVYGQLEVARGDPATARDHFMAALAICDRLGEGLYRAHIERDLAALG
jgi:transcriptional regulator with XRE-family HTH domain/tetratricopeptide (TPR) repeat protein